MLMQVLQPCTDMGENSSSPAEHKNEHHKEERTLQNLKKTSIMIWDKNGSWS